MSQAPHPNATPYATGIRVELGGDVARVRSEAARAATSQGFSPRTVHLTEQVAAEMAVHLVHVQGDGRMLVRLLDHGELHGVQLVLSTTSTKPMDAEDLRAAIRPPNLCETYAVPGKGTVMTVHLWAEPPRSDGRRFLDGAMSDPIQGESHSGDAWAIEQSGARIVALVADGLGHGEKAATAGEAAVCAFRESHLAPVEEIAAHLHERLRSTRGAAIALAEVDRDRSQLRFCGIGNVVARLLGEDRAHELVGRYGIAGYQDPQILTVTRDWAEDDMLVMHTDGLSSRWNVDSYPDLRLQHPQLVAATVMRDALRGNDDALVIALRGVPERAGPTGSEVG